MKYSKLSVVPLSGMVGAIAVASGCSAPIENEDASLEVDTDTTTAQQVTTSVNADGVWTANATGTGQDAAANWARADFTGPWGKTRRMGVCLLKTSTTVCNSVADCSASPATLPAGGFRYCSAPNGTGSKVCMWRPGPNSTFCAGTPAIAGSPPVSPGSYQSPTVWSGKGKFVSYACFEGCAVTDPSSSSAEQAALDVWGPCKLC